MANPSAAADTASTVLALSKTAWKLRSFLSRLDQETPAVDATIKNLAGDIKSLGTECDLVHAELEEVVRKNDTGSLLPYDLDGRLWSCLVTQLEETSRTVQELELFAQDLRGEAVGLFAQAQRQRKLDKSRNQTASIGAKVCRHTDNLRITLLLINLILVHIAPGRADRGLVRKLDKLQEMAEELRKSSEARRLSHTEATLMQCAHEVIVKGSNMYETALAAESVAGGQGATNRNICVAEWVSTLESISWDQRRSNLSDIVSNVPSVFSGDEEHTTVTSDVSGQRAVLGNEAIDAAVDDYEDDLDTDLAKAALGTGTKAFEAQEWEEADSLLQEALRVLQQLPKQQRAFCDVFGLHYKLAVCAFYMHEPADAEEVLMSLVQQSASSDEERELIYNAAHLLSLVYICMGQIERARSECEKALQARRRLLGKLSDPSLESTALMAHIYVLLDNRARAKSCLAMIPEARRDAVMRIVQAALGAKVEQVSSPSLSARSISGDSDMVVDRIRKSLSAIAPKMAMRDRCYGPVSARISQEPSSNSRQAEGALLQKVGVEDPQSIAVASISSAEERSESRAVEKGQNERYSAFLEVNNVSEKETVNEGYSDYPEAISPSEPPEAEHTTKGKSPSRKEILDKIGCRPRDSLEDAVCEGDRLTFENLLNSKKGFWRSKLRKRVRPERATALHFAALFGEIDMARRLISSGYNVNEIPYGYSTSLTPLKFAIGARQVEMVEFLIANGAKPSDPDSWSTLAGQLMNRSWLMKTMSETDKENAPNRMIAIMGVLLKHGWYVNVPFETSGRTVLHQAVTFWSGSYRWDLHLRATITSFLCEQGADPLQADTDGKTPYDLALASGHQDILLILGRVSAMKRPDPVEPG